jgi:hypothetical protein
MIKAVISQSIVDVGRLLHDPMAEGYSAKREDGGALRTLLICHAKRVGDSVIDIDRVSSLITLRILSKIATHNRSFFQAWGITGCGHRLYSSGMLHL